MTLETWNDSSYLPDWLEWIRNEKEFLNIYNDIKKLYGDDFSDNEIKLVKESRAWSCAEYKWVFNDTRRAIAKNRIDSILFRSKYINFCDLDSEYIMRLLPNAGTQRNFRNIVMELEDEFGWLYPTEIEVVKTKLKNEIRKKPKSNSPIFETLYNNLYEFISNDRNEPIGQPESWENWGQVWWSWLEWYNWDSVVINNTPENMDDYSQHVWDEWNNVKWRIPPKQIEYMSKIPISKDFENMKVMILSYISFDDFSYYDKEWNKRWLSSDKIAYLKKYTNAVFNYFAKQITELWNWSIPKEFFSDHTAISTILEYMQNILIGNEVDEKKLVEDLKDVLYSYDDFVKDMIKDVAKDSNEILKTIDPEELEKIEVTQEELNDIKIILKDEDPDKTMEDLIISYKAYKYLTKRKSDLWELDPKQEKLLQKLTDMFKYIKRRVLNEINSKGTEKSYSKWFNLKSLQTSPEYATWNIRDISPAAIVENNEQINRFVYGNNLSSIDMNSDIYLSPDERKQLFDKLKEQKKWDYNFMESIKYLDDYWNINTEKANTDNIDTESLKNNKEKIDEMIQNLAIEEKRNSLWKDKINEILTRKSIMISCFSAISSFFNTSNNNLENFAHEFEIEDVNKNIEFDEKTWIIKMKWTIWKNKNHIWLYYNTNTWELSFDNFLAYSSETWYKIWKWNWETEKLKITLPTMNEMKRTANSINFGLIDKLSPNIDIYNRMVWMAMRESIRFNCFEWFMGSDMKVNQEFVAQYTEKNILKQDIIKSVYKKYYNSKDIDDIFNNENKYLTINEWNEPQQFKLIKLISDSIDHYDSAEQLLNFRLYVNQLDKLLSSKNVVERDPVLKALYGDNLSSDNDKWDMSKQIMKRENENIALSENGNNNRYTYEDPQSSKQWDLWNTWENIWDLVFYGMFSEEKWGKKIINLNRLHDWLNIMSRTEDWSTLLDLADEYSWFEKNLHEYANELPDFQTQILQENIAHMA